MRTLPPYVDFRIPSFGVLQRLNRMQNTTMNPAATPAPVEDVQGDERWMSMHNLFINLEKDKEPEVLFIGDSLIQGMQFSNIWKTMFEPLHCLNFGIGGDQTQHVLWRVQNGELKHIKPSVIVLLVGTNNHDHNVAQVTEGIVEITKVIREKQPEAQLIVMGIPPRGEKPNKLREKIAAINKNLEEQLKGCKNVMFFNVDPSSFIGAEGRISTTDMYDFLHFTSEGYRKLCEPLVEEIQNLLKNFVKVENMSTMAESMDGQLASDQP